MTQNDMQIIRHFERCPDDATGAVMALGNFDGVHRGHRAVIAEVKRLAHEMNTSACVMTFEPHPRRVFAPEMPPMRIVPFHVKARKLSAEGIDTLFVKHFTPRFAQTSAEAFVNRILLEQLRVKHVVVGRDFHFGHNREGNAAYLKDMAQKKGFGFTQLAGVSQDGENCSSSRVRTLLAEGDVRHAAQLLGDVYEITGGVIHGHARGRSIGFPTANIIPHGIFLPRLGVYAVQMAVGEALWDAPRWMNGVANLGKRPTFHGSRVVLEAHCFDCDLNFYDQHARVRLVEFLRPEKTFDGVEPLKQQIALDAQQAREVLGRAIGMADTGQNV